jgi:DNA repair protein RecO
LAGALQPFQRLRVVLERRPGRELWRIVDAEVVEPFGAVASDAARYAMAAWVVELAREVAPEGEAEAGQHAASMRCLRALEGAGAQAWILVAALLEVLRRAGVEPALEGCSACGRPAPPGRSAHFEAPRGVVCTDCGGTGPVLRGRARAAALAARAWRPPPPGDEPALAEAAILLCGAAHHHLGKELRAWSLLGAHLRVAAAPAPASE